MISLIAFTRRGCLLGERLAEELAGRLWTTDRLAPETGLPACGKLRDWTEARFADSEALVFISAAGIAVRAIAPFVKDKFSDPAVVSVDEAGRFVVPLLSGHVGGANDLARRIAALTADPDDSSISQLRYSGYARALRELGIPPEEEDVICADDFTVESGCRAMRERLKRPADFTAVFAIADDMAIGAMRALRESGRSIPEDCSIIAIDGINVSEYIHPMLTTLCQPMTAMGTKSVELLLGVIRGGAHDHLTLPTTLRAGESVRDLTK